MDIANPLPDPREGDEDTTLVDALAVAGVQRAQAEAAETMAMLALHDAELARIKALDSPLQKLTERGGLVLEIAQTMALSEGQAHQRLATARRVRDEAPTVWTAYVDGYIDHARVREISLTIERLTRSESVTRLDEAVVEYAGTHTTAELRAWLKRCVVRLEPDEALQRAEKAREDRYVQVTHLDDGMAWLTAYLPSHVAAAIDKRLTREACALGSADGRTRAQRRADLLASWLTTSETTQATWSADIAITLEADILTGLTDGYTESTDGAWAVPATWILREADADHTFFHRMLIEPITGDVLAHQYVGRFAPELLAKAIQFRDGRCRAPGCRVPADRCDLDHREPWPTGATTAENVWALCRRHHSLKGHGVLQWRLPSGTPVPA